MIVVGGTYWEETSYPETCELFGSGLRATIAISTMAREAHEAVRLLTYVGGKDLEHFDLVSRTFGLDVSPLITDLTVRFQYLYPLAVPTLSLYSRVDSEMVVEDKAVVLRYGMLESSAKVKGTKVIYDPQSPVDPEPFHENGSEAEELAIVCNRGEGAALTGEKSIRSIGAGLLERHGAKIAVIKDASRGAWVFAADVSEHVQSFPSERIWKIGSGDIFTAVFAFYWGVKNFNPVKAAKFASMATAHYCSTQQLPIQTGFEEFFAPDPPKTRPKKVYLAGPFFTLSQRWLVNEVKAILEDEGHEVFSPVHNVGLSEGHDFVSADLEALDKSDLVFALLSDFDAGTIFEVGYARRKGLPVIGFCELVDSRLTMLLGSDCQIFRDLTTAVYHVSWAE